MAAATSLIPFDNNSFHRSSNLPCTCVCCVAKGNHKRALLTRGVGLSI